MSGKVSQKVEQLCTSDKLPWIIISIGIALRLIRYLHNPSLWFDEAVYAGDIISRSLTEFINPSPDYDQAQPLGFYIYSKLAVLAFGNSEYALRLFPLMFGILSLICFFYVAKKYLSRYAVPAALALFAILEPLVYYSSILKPYSGDLFCTLLIYCFTAYIQSRELNVAHFFIYALMGATVIWFSNPSVFVMAGVGASLSLSCLSSKDWPRLGKLITVYVIWALSFGTSYFIYIASQKANIVIGLDELLKQEFAYMPFPPTSIANMRWFIDTFFDIFNFPAGFTLTGIAALTFLVGCLAIFHENKNRFFLLISPAFFAFLAAAVHQYPFKGRFMLFFVPLILLFVAEGIDYVRYKARNNSIMIVSVLIGVIFIYPVSWAAYHIKTPASREEIKPVLSHIADNWQDGDIIYVHFYSQYTFSYYTKYYPQPYVFDEKDSIIGIAPRGWHRKWKKDQVSKYYDTDSTSPQSNMEILEALLKDINKLKGHKRVWVLFSGSVSTAGFSAERFILFNLDTIGQKLDSFGRPGIAVTYLYDLSGVSIGNR